VNFEQLKRNVGDRVRLVPPACHLDAAGDALPAVDEEWSIISVTTDLVEIGAESGHSYRLGKDHIRNYTTDPGRSAQGERRAFLTLNVQLFVEANGVRAVPNHQPGAPVPPPTNRAVKARASFAPELQRIFRRQVEILDRIIPNYTQTSHARGPCEGDSWTSLKPALPNLYSSSPLVHDLGTTDSEPLSEFYAGVYSVNDTLENWRSTDHPLDNYNAWNALMHRVQHTLRAGQLAVQRFCPDRLYDPIVPVSGTLLSRSERSLSIADEVRRNFMDRCAAAGGSVPVSNPMGRRTQK
jgi:hypothetical protein